jgi:hypothetical protein
MGSKTTFQLSHFGKRCRVLPVLAGVWPILMLSKSFLPITGLPFDPTSLRISIIITSIVAVPLILIALFVNDDYYNNNTSMERITDGVTV